MIQEKVIEKICVFFLIKNLEEKEIMTVYKTNFFFK